MTKPRYKTGTWSGYPHYACTLCPYDTLDKGEIVHHVRDRHPTEAEGAVPAGPLAGIDFASDEAAELASELGVQAEHFTDSPSGKSGYTVADVRHAAKALTNPTEG
ncbi:MAG: hypothetical protein AMXMBFR53_29940 [Gemmatimonadota bacterium]